MIGSNNYKCYYIIFSLNIDDTEKIFSLLYVIICYLALFYRIHYFLNLSRHLKNILNTFYNYFNSILNKYFFS